MRINQFIASATGISRRAADQAIANGRVTINNRIAVLGDIVDKSHVIILDQKRIIDNDRKILIAFNKPVGLTTSKKEQGDKTIYSILPKKLHKLKPVGRLDKSSSGLLLLTNDGHLAHQLMHPRFNKDKIYLVTLNKTLQQSDLEQLKSGVNLTDGLSKLKIANTKNKNQYQVTIHEGRNRQIRRTFETIGFKVKSLHRIQIGPYSLNGLNSGEHKII
jgi:23S rRNA pseudouridine2605 synthase